VKIGRMNRKRNARVAFPALASLRGNLGRRLLIKPLKSLIYIRMFSLHSQRRTTFYILVIYKPFFSYKIKDQPTIYQISVGNMIFRC
jgi:hypothetical protein